MGRWWLVMVGAPAAPPLQSKAGVCQRMHTVHELAVVPGAVGTSGLGSTLIPAHLGKAQARESDLQALSSSGLGSPEHRPDMFTMHGRRTHQPGTRESRLGGSTGQGLPPQARTSEMQVGL